MWSFAKPLTAVFPNININMNINVCVMIHNMKVADGVRGDKGRITDFLNNHTRLWIHTNTLIYTRQHKKSYGKTLTYAQ